MEPELKGKVAVVTGSGRGIGRAIALVLAKCGAHVVAAARTVEQIDSLAEQIAAAGGRATAIPTDVTEETSVLALFEKVREDLGRLDVLVNNAGLGIYGEMIDFDVDDFDRVLAVNLRGTFLCSREAMRMMVPRKEGYIINISSVVGFKGYPNQSEYTASKHALRGMSIALAEELRSDNIRVHVICPGLLYTRAWQVLASNIQKSSPKHADKDPYDVFVELVRSQTPLGREQTPEDVGRLTAFLCSDEARNLTGQVMALDGGMTLQTAG